MRELLKAAIAPVTALMIVASALTTPAQAQVKSIDTIDQNELVESVNIKSILPALSVVSANEITSVDADGNSYLIATAMNGLKFDVRLRACVDQAQDAVDAGSDTIDTPDHCRGVLLVSTWDALTENKAADFTNVAMEFQATHPAVNAGQLANGSPYVVRYVIADFGLPQGNLVSEFANFLRAATEFQNDIAPLYIE